MKTCKVDISVDMPQVSCLRMIRMFLISISKIYSAKVSQPEIYVLRDNIVWYQFQEKLTKTADDSPQSIRQFSWLELETSVMVPQLKSATNAFGLDICDHTLWRGWREMMSRSAQKPLYMPWAGKRLADGSLLSSTKMERWKSEHLYIRASFLMVLMIADSWEEADDDEEEEDWEVVSSLTDRPAANDPGSFDSNLTLRS